MAVICVDVCEFDYLNAAVAAGVAPFIGKRAFKRGRAATVLGAPTARRLRNFDIFELALNRVSAS
jgi:hypothetical protein